MIDFSKVPFPDSPGGATAPVEGQTVVGKIVDLGKERNLLKDIAAAKEMIAISEKLGQHFDTDPASMPDPGSIVDLDLPGAKRALALFNNGISEIEKRANEIVVDSPEKAEIATELAAQTLRLGDKIDDRRKEIIKDPDGYVRQVNAFVKPMQDRIKNIAGKGGILKRKLGDYNTRVELDRRESEKKQREEAAKLQAELDAKAKAQNITPVQVAPVAIPTRSGPTRSASGSSSSKMIVHPDITDLSALPRSYIEGIFKKKSYIDGDDPLDGTTEAIWSRLRTVIMEAHTAGLRDIPGVNFKEKSDISIRRTA